MIDYNKLTTQRVYDCMPLCAKRFENLQLPDISTKASKVKGAVQLKPGVGIIAKNQYLDRKLPTAQPDYDPNHNLRFRNNCQRQVRLDNGGSLREQRQADLEHIDEVLHKRQHQKKRSITGLSAYDPTIHGPRVIDGRHRPGHIEYKDGSV